jgi:hypothetical protein
MIKQAIAQKEFQDDTDPETTANIMQAFMSGFSIFSKKVVSEKKLQAMCQGRLKNCFKSCGRVGQKNDYSNRQQH